MTPTAEAPADEEFESEVRAMLARRAGDVSPSTVPTGDVVALSAARAPHRRPRPRLVAAAAAVVLLGAATYVVARDPGTPSTTTIAGGQAGEPIVWPLDGHVGADVLATPETAAAAYLGEVVPDVAPPTVEAAVVDADRATVAYRLGQGRGEVALRRESGRWGVTAASSDAVRIDRVDVVDDRVEVATSLGDGVVDGTVVWTMSVGEDGVATVRNSTGIVLVERGDGVHLEPGSDPATTLVLAADDSDSRSIALTVPAGSPLPVAVRVDLVAADDGDPSTTEPVIGHATAAVVAPVDGQEETATTPTVPTTAQPASERAAVVPGEGTPDDVAPPSGVLFVGSGSAAEVAGAYLDDRLPDRVDGMRIVPGSGTEAGSGGGELVEVRWEIADDPEMAGRYSGTILLRSDPGGWSVLRATTDQISLDVARDGDGVAVAIDWTDPEADDGVDMTLLDAGGRPVSDDVFVMFATPGVTEVPVERGLDQASVRSVLVRHVGGTWFSITEVRLP